MPASLCKLLPYLIPALCILDIRPIHGQPGSLDTSFDPGSGISKNGTARVSSIALQNDGKILIAGDFTTVNGVVRKGIARLNENGSLDTTFDPTPGANEEVLSIVAQPDGKVLLGGSFTNLNGMVRNRIGRLNANGSLDTTFDPGGGANFDVNSVALQLDGKVIIGGGFDQINGATRNSIARLNPTGSLDLNFDAGSGPDGPVQRVVLQGSDKLVIGGSFTTVADVPRKRIARLNLDGSLDAGFNPSSGTDGDVFSVAPQSDGKVLIVGAFTSVNGTAQNRIARLNADGSLDADFNPGSGASGDIITIGLQPDGKILIGGNFDQINGATRGSIARLNGDGTLDRAFDPAQGADGSIQALAVQPDGKVLIGGFISSVNGIPRNGIARLQGGNVELAPQLFNPVWNNGTFAVSLSTISGQRYVLEFKNDLSQAGWSALPVVLGNGTILTLSDPAAGVPFRFYRVLVQ